jgi:hypothetical protein
VVLGVVATAIMVSLSTGVSAGSASTKACIGTLGSITVENVVVPGQASCVLDATQVTGNVVVEPGGSLRATMGTVIGGNITGKKGSTVSISRIDVGGRIGCTGCRRVNIFESGVHGDATITGTAEFVSVSSSSVSGDLTIMGGGGDVAVTRGSVVGGDLLIAGNHGALLFFRTEVGGDAVVVDNASSAGFIVSENIVGGGLEFSRNLGPSELNMNQVAETLACTGNVPAPVGSGNVAGAATGQCVGL